MPNTPVSRGNLADRAIRHPNLGNTVEVALADNATYNLGTAEEGVYLITGRTTSTDGHIGGAIAFVRNGLVSFIFDNDLFGTNGTDDNHLHFYVSTGDLIVENTFAAETTISLTRLI